MDCDTSILWYCHCWDHRHIPSHSVLFHWDGVWQTFFEELLSYQSQPPVQLGMTFTCHCTKLLVDKGLEKFFYKLTSNQVLPISASQVPRNSNTLPYSQTLRFQGRVLWLFRGRTRKIPRVKILSLHAEFSHLGSFHTVKKSGHTHYRGSQSHAGRGSESQKHGMAWSLTWKCWQDGQWSGLASVKSFLRARPS
jgi:hypothetical protein